mgnify:CR=1 FL=1
MSESLHIVCPHCHTTNRVKTTDLSSAPDCGGCHKPLFTGQPLALDEAGFDRHIGRSQIPVLVDATVNGAKRKLVLTANRNAFYYALDRVTGEFLGGRDVEGIVAGRAAGGRC